ncbi:MAG: response regulator [Planctomycetota bacterium]
MSEHPAPAADKPIVFAVDDTPSALLLIERVLEGRYEVRTFAAADALLDAVNDTLPDVIVSDIVMPDVSGTELVSQLRSDARTRHVPVILLTGKDGRDGLDDALDRGADDYLRKPIKADELLVRVGTALRNSQIYKELQSKHELLIEAQGQLVHSQKLKAIGQLAAGIAHEINTPLQYVGDNVDFLREAFADLSTLMRSFENLLAEARNAPALAPFVEDVQRVTNDIDLEYYREQIPRALEQSQHGIGTVSEIVRAIKQFSHPGKNERRLGSTNKAITNTILVARHEWKYVAEVLTDLDPNLPHVPLLAAEFNQVLLNLIVNAAHSIAEVVGDGAKGKGVIHISTRQHEGYVEVRVRDTGAGVSEEARAHLFDPFFTTKEEGHGSGQGLAIARSVIVDKHGGEIFLEQPDSNRGCTFVMHLPLSAETDSVLTRA